MYATSTSTVRLSRTMVVTTVEPASATCSASYSMRDSNCARGRFSTARTGMCRKRSNSIDLSCPTTERPILPS